MAAEHREIVQRRCYNVTGENADEATVDKLISTEESEAFYRGQFRSKGGGSSLPPNRQQSSFLALPPTGITSATAAFKSAINTHHESPCHNRLWLDVLSSSIATTRRYLSHRLTTSPSSASYSQSPP
ncbi:hypothetical protein L1987_44769 [Smallanthus sonchifolius]|uniref:Uncharacterized protein n=1 Tax=Smallanthus sonchifolius TaxID=185202 RepID=A0ACB9GRN0_9ASTR|nr:hypothetical protein L1987_44769 [Smallanthus sonchifolius]